MCCAFVGLDNKLYKMQATYIKIRFLRSIQKVPGLIFVSEIGYPEWSV